LFTPRKINRFWWNLEGGTAMRRLMGKQKIKELVVKSFKLEGAKD
jgi:hypothetical protein